MTLYPFQQVGVNFLATHDRAYNADGMGLGKTVQAAAAAHLIGAKSALVVAPASTLENWRRVWSQWAPHTRLDVASWADPNLAAIDGGLYDVVILDEAHYAKSPRARRTLGGLNVAMECQRSWLLSGTPMPNDPGELWAPIRALWPEIPKALGITSYRQWFETFCLYRETKWGRKAYGVKNAEILKPFLDRIMIRRSLADVRLDLPDLRVDIQLLPQDAGFAQAIREQGIDPVRLHAQIMGETAKGEDASMSRLRRFLGTYKAPLIAQQIAEELEAGAYQQIVVMAYHKDVLAILRQGLKKFGVVGFDGSTSLKARQDAIDLFNSNPTERVFITQQTAAGTGTDGLQVACEIVLVEPAWTPDENRQAIKRVHRIGSRLPVRARVFAVAGSIDEGVMGTLVTKARMQAALGL
jgi:SWI/SNF-related matrix-associated actin-dependent regulator of chromatin subfamily A-like protein 1